MIVAPAKMGKSILAQQLACSLTNGAPFLDTFEISKPVTVWYFATEGKDEDIKDRLIRMNKVIPINPDRFLLFCSAGLRFNTRPAQKIIKDLLEQYKDRLPKVIIIDALYRAIKGSIKDDDTVNEFHHVVGKLADICDSAVVFVHHMKKPQRLMDGSFGDRSDNDAYGSAFLNAAVDHIYWMEQCTKNRKDKILRCDTQRSGKIIEDLRLTLIEPDPLFFKIVSQHEEELHKIRNVLLKEFEGMDITKLMKKTNLKRSTLYTALKEMLDKGEVEKSDGYPRLYRLL